MKHNSKGNAWLVAIVTALFVAQAPLCAVACFDAGDAKDAEAASASEHGCHESAPASSPAAPSGETPPSHDDCGCDVQAEALVSQSIDATSISLHAILLETTRHTSIDSWAERRSPIRAAIDLPPPDILLLKSTLII